MEKSLIRQTSQKSFISARTSFSKHSSYPFKTYEFSTGRLEIATKSNLLLRLLSTFLLF